MHGKKSGRDKKIENWTSNKHAIIQRIYDQISTKAHQINLWDLVDLPCYSNVKNA
jgi:hypothetical protein